MIIAYMLNSNFEDYKSEWIKNSDRDKVCCSNPKCHRLLNKNYFNDAFIFNKKQSDIYYINCGGIYLVSHKFQLFITENKIEDVKFISLPKVSEFSFLKLEKEIKVDRTQVDDTDICPICEQRISASMSIGCRDYQKKKVTRMLETKEEIKEGIFRTDMEFGVNVSFSEIIVVGTQTKLKIEKSGLRGIYFRSIIPTDEEV